MTHVTIPRDLAERASMAAMMCAKEWPDLAARGVTYAAVSSKLEDALLAPQEALTAEECGRIAKRVEAIRSKKVSLMSDAHRAQLAMLTLALQLEDQEAESAPAPTWDGPQPKEDVN